MSDDFSQWVGPGQQTRVDFFEQAGLAWAAKREKIFPTFQAKKKNIIKKIRLLYASI